MKKWIALLLAAIMCIFLAACGESKFNEKATAAINEHIAPILADYQVSEYFPVISPSEDRYDIVIVSPSVGSMTYGNLCALIKELIALEEVQDPSEVDKQYKFSGTIYEDCALNKDGYIDYLEVEYYYYVNSAQAQFSNRPSAGLYCSSYSQCLYAD